MHSAAAADPGAPRKRFALAASVFLAVLVAAVLLSAPAARATAARGVVDHRLEYSSRVPLHRIAEYRR